jgi:hypothetical protein
MGMAVLVMCGMAAVTPAAGEPARAGSGRAGRDRDDDA